MAAARAGLMNSLGGIPLGRPGRPDFVFQKKRVVVFLDGCFWHGCPRCFAAPKSNVEYWAPKIAGNAARDRRIRAELRATGWTVVGIWEHELRAQPARCLSRLQKALEKPTNVK